MWLLLFASQNHLQAAAEAAPSLPRLFVLGDKDNFTSETSLRATLDQYFSAHTTTAAVVQGADHFWFRRERDIFGVVGQWLLEAFPQLHGKLTCLRDLEFGVSVKKYGTKFGAAALSPGAVQTTAGVADSP